MARNPHHTKARNEYIVQRFRQLTRQNPHWRTEYIIEKIAKDVFLSQVTIVNIIKKTSNDKVPTAATMSRKNRHEAV